jgi:hypothetical protein
MMKAQEFHKEWVREHYPPENWGPETDVEWFEFAEDYAVAYSNDLFQVHAKLMQKQAALITRLNEVFEEFGDMGATK